MSAGSICSYAAHRGAMSTEERAIVRDNGRDRCIGYAAESRNTPIIAKKGTPKGEVKTVCAMGMQRSLCYGDVNDRFRPT